MSGEGAPRYSGASAEGMRVAIAAARWHEQVMDGLLAGAARALAEAGVTSPTVLRVPGAFELPLAGLHLSRLGYDAVIALGVVIRGGTPHFEYVCQAATEGLSKVAVESGVPIGFGLLTCDTEEQALDRAGLHGSRENKGYEAAQAAIVTALEIHELLRLH